jgi:hypothetical protein
MIFMQQVGNAGVRRPRPPLNAEIIRDGTIYVGSTILSVFAR